MNFRDLPVVLFLAGLWIQLCLVLLPSWQSQSYYDYGWIIPPLILFFGFHRWLDESSTVTPGGGGGRGLWILVILLTLGLLPVRIIEHVDIYWRFPLWVHASLVLVVTHLTIAQFHGWKTSQALLPASLFIFLAVPLPSQIEQPFVNSLTKGVLEFTSFLLPISGYPIMISGSSFIVQGEILDVAEGCSGIRSFQSCIVAALALGELARFSVTRRLVLLVLSLGLAVVTNSLRVFVLVQTAHREGRESMDAAHDGIGFWTTIITFSTIALVAWLLTLFSAARPGKKTRSRRQLTPPPSQTT